MLGDWEVTFSGNVFNERDRVFFIDLTTMAHRRGFNSFVRNMEVVKYGKDPRHELPLAGTENADVALAVTMAAATACAPEEVSF